jgi:putative oxidoreductase
MEARQHDLTTSIGLLILRVGIGGFMITHGWGKLLQTIDGNTEFVGDPIGIGPTPSAILLTGAEFLCALLVIVGAATRFAALPLVIAMGVAAFVAHGGDPWTMETAAELFQKGQTPFPAAKEIPLMYFTVFLSLIFTGAGRYSIDAIIRPRRG